MNSYADILSRNPDAWSLLMAGALGGFVVVVITMASLLYLAKKDDADQDAP